MEINAVGIDSTGMRLRYIRNYAVTYTRPAFDTCSVPWKDNQGGTGFVHTNTFHKQIYYPIGIKADTYTLTGTTLPSTNINRTNPAFVSSTAFAFGYSDSTAGGDTVDIANAIDKNGNDFFFKLKTPWYMALHGLLTDDIYREHILIGYILDDKIDDILGQIPEEEKEAHERIHKIIAVIRKELSIIIEQIEELYQKFADINYDRKSFAAKYIKNFYFKPVIDVYKGEELKKLSTEEALEIYNSIDKWEDRIKSCDIYEVAKNIIRDQTRRLIISREWLKKRDPSLFFQDPEENEDNN